MATKKETEATAAPVTGEELTKAKRAQKREAGFRADGSPHPGVDPDTGERKAVTLAGLREEFGHRAGTRLYNSISVAAFGGVHPHLPDLDLASMEEEANVPPGPNESEEDYAARMAKRGPRRNRVRQLIAEAEREVD